MDIKKNQLIELTISDLAFGGKGFAKIDGLAVFVDQTIPMDRVIAKVIKKKKNYAEANIVEFIEKSPYRINPFCAYSGFCGGCKLQFLNYDEQLKYKRIQVEDSLKHIGLLKDITIHPVIASNPIFEYRNKIEFSCSNKRWLLPNEMAEGANDDYFAIGFHVPCNFYKVIDIEGCLLYPQLGNLIFQDIKTFLKTSGKEPYNIRSNTGFWRFLMLRHSLAFDQWMVNIVTADEDHKVIKLLADKIVEKYPQVSSFINNITSKKSGTSTGEKEFCFAGAPYINEKLGDYSFEISANSFFQTNTRGAINLYETVKNYASLNGDEIIFDLYCGTGTISIWLSKFAQKVIGIDLIESSIADAQKNCINNKISNCSFITGDIKDSISKINLKPDVMVIDPPRTGMHKHVIKQVIDMSPQKIVYVSCNPTTLARDLNLLKDNYKILEVQPIDMFPHTHHIESVTRLTKI